MYSRIVTKCICLLQWCLTVLILSIMSYFCMLWPFMFLARWFNTVEQWSFVILKSLRIIVNDIDWSKWFTEKPVSGNCETKGQFCELPIIVYCWNLILDSPTNIGQFCAVLQRLTRSEEFKEYSLRTGSRIGNWFHWIFRHKLDHVEYLFTVLLFAI
jgi:hypothetical protein